MKNFILTLCLIPTLVFAQYSNYYKVDVNSNSNVNLNGNVNVNKNVSGTVNVNKTISTIDYGALAQANALREKNRLESQIYANDLARQQALEIASNPLKAFDYGYDNIWYAKGSDAKNVLGIKKATLYYKKPNESLFVNTGGWNSRNESEDGVITEIEIVMFYVPGVARLPENASQKENFNNYLKYNNKTEEFVKLEIEEYKKGELNNDNYVHKTDINKAKVAGQNGFVWSNFYEDDYDYVIKDNYRLLSNGWIVFGGARYKGDKDYVNFEMIEGRRYYFRRLVNQIMATIRIDDVKY